ncbi:spore coat protein YlbD [Jeotgalibacillus proteolyticus]|uniref:Cytosolic protein n=1 Tax=Jeotgalibacillus proteolyticus TaxID=2082395 RepID=A0A2S5GGW2_9BACL|nr:spore coat protein YlbD [Jeotgalibacillus proteolyticus]PPA72164.1 hypothetical protein C4B60_01950 [Jeotgalibacillus proteolyticus]
MEEREKKLQDFKAFIVKHPHIVQKVRKGESTWQNLFEEWYLFGEDDKRWKKDSEEEASTKQSNQWLQTVKKKIQSLDDDQIEQYVEQCKDALEMVSDLLAQFQTKKPDQEITKNQSYMTYWK